jgi:2-iminobutanoate/2-iminopropanoate deaminase
MSKKPVATPNAPQAIGPYHQAITFNGLIYTSGQIPLTPEGTLVSQDIRDQTLQCLKNINAILQTAGTDYKTILKTTLFIKNMNDFSLINEVYQRFFEGSVFPARSTVEVARLPKDVLIEIEAVAYIP